LFEINWIALLIILGDLNGSGSPAGEPISLFWVERSHRTREQETMHEYLSGKHVIEASWILGDNPLVVLAWQVIYENLQPSNRIVF
jgi:hypothetical protein